MIRVLVSILFLATNAVAITACEQNDCDFNPAQKKTITSITEPAPALWRPATQQDTIDKLIFAGKPIPYSFQDIQYATEVGYVYVLTHEYLPILMRAQERITMRKQAIERQSAEIYASGATAEVHSSKFKRSVINQQAFTLAKKRLELYRKIMNNKFSRKTHNCPGCILHHNTALCVTQWAFWQNE